MALLRAAIGLAAIGVAVALAPVADAQPVGAENAQTTIDRLEEEGYDVRINWVNSVTSTPLYLCRSIGVNNPNRSGEPPQGITVYVDVTCPDYDDWDL